MSSYEKEMEDEFEKFWVSDCHGWEKERCAEFNLSKISFEAGAKWQASRLTEEKIISILEDHSSTTDSGATSVLESVHKEDWHKAAKEILALLKGEDEK